MVRRKNSAPQGTPSRSSGSVAKGGGVNLTTTQVSSLPLVNEILERMRLSHFLEVYLPRRPRVPSVDGALLLVRNILLSREPVYGVGDWAQQFAPDLLGLTEGQVASLNDDRVGRCLDKVFVSDYGSMVLALVSHVVKGFDVDLDELHNDSTTVTFHGRYEEAQKGARVQGKETRAITWGHNKDHRPDLKQLLFILTASRDGGVPLYFNVADGNVSDDQTHRDTWDLLCQITGRSDFLYVADSKLATKENMAHIQGKGGRFVTVLPRTRREDRVFRERVRRGTVRWKRVTQRKDQHGKVVEETSVAAEPSLSAEGYRLLWYNSSRKKELDAQARSRKIERTLEALTGLGERLALPRTRFRDREKVEGAVERILREGGAEPWVRVSVLELDQEHYLQDRPGRPGPDTRFRREVKTRFDLDFEIDQDAVARDAATDGIFPVITNDLTLRTRELLAAYKRQPVIEKRFSQLKNDFVIAPVFLKNAGRVEALLCVYFLAMLTQILLEREVRRRMKARGVESLPLYHENRASKAPTARRVLDAFGNVLRHELRQRGQPNTELVTELSPLQQEILALLEVPLHSYGHRPRSGGLDTHSSTPKKRSHSARS
jgi:transposase